MSVASILVVDDDPETCRLLSTVLERKDFQVETAFGGEEGLKKVHVSEPDLVVLDIMMPDMDGWETCRRMKEIADIPILFLSARADVASVAQGFKEGGDDYIFKPFQTMDLTTRIEKLLLNGARSHHDTPALIALDTEYVPEVVPVQRSLNLCLFLKRLMDILVAVLALILLSPLMLLIAALIKLDSPGPVTFKQERIRPAKKSTGSAKSPQLETFSFYKFRTMYHGASSEPHREYLQAFIKNDHEHMEKMQCSDRRIRKLSHDSRVTRLGRFLRKSSLDEIPQLWNVLKGDMSLVGPRPPIPYEVEMYEPWHRSRLLVKPGLTGLWQVTARSSADFDEMVRIDIWYIEHQSLWLDLKIILKTPLSVLSMEGAI
jgi:lipopolysaccharide/colanic/teichoic acid biosynthesis glycosyltransferase/ActR/RegA family two-component response regulator